MTTEIATQSPTQKPKPAEILRAQLDERRALIQLPAHITYDKFCSIVITAVSMDPALLAADRGSLLTSCMQAASLGLVLDKKQAALVVFREKARDASGKDIMGPDGRQLVIAKVQCQTMIAGVLKCLRNSGELSTIMSACVYAADYFEFELGLEQRLVHRPCIDGDRGRLRCVYAMAQLKDGSKVFEVMTLDQVDRRRAVSKSKNGPWVDWYDEMARKTVLRMLCKVLPSSSDMENLVASMDAEVDLSIGRRPASSLIGGAEPLAIDEPSASAEGEVME